MNKIIELLKWPIALLMVALFMPALSTDVILMKELMNNTLLIHFLLPFFATIIFVLFAPGFSQTFIAIAEHELTHALFAVATFHKPAGFFVDENSGGYFTFKGKGNWLIAIAPYFFPTFLGVIIALTPIYKAYFGVLPDFYIMLLGIFMGLHFITTAFSIHPKQTDFKVAGYVFTVLFLPTINLITYGLLFAYVALGFKGFSVYFTVLIQESVKYLK